MEKYRNKQAGFMTTVAGIIGVVVLSGFAYVVIQSGQQPEVVEEPAAVEVESDIVDAEVQAQESRPGYTTRRRVEVLKSNEQGDPNANRYDLPVDGEVSEEVVTESAVQGDPDANKYDFGTTGEADANAYEAEAAESSNAQDDNCDSSTGSDSDCEALDSDDDDDGIPTEVSESETNPLYSGESATAENPTYQAN